MRTRGASIILSLALVAAIAMPAPVTAAPASHSDESTRMPADAQAVMIRRVLDGDNLIVRVVGPGTQLPFGERVTIRLAGIAAHAGDSVGCVSNLARTRLTRLVPPGHLAWVSTESSAPDESGVWSIYLWNSTVFVNADLVLGGHATLDRAATSAEYSIALLAAQASAARQGSDVSRRCTVSGRIPGRVNPGL